MTTPAFHTTRWSLVTRSAAADPKTAQKALRELCEMYWYPLYAYLRRRGKSESDAHDLVQSFCVRLLEDGGLGGADRDVGSFRGYMLGALRNFENNEVRRENTQKRGGNAVTFSLDDAEQRYATEPADEASPEVVFERRWVQALLDRAGARLREEYAAKGRGALHAALLPTLLCHDDAVRHVDIATELDTSEGAIKVALHRMRARMRELIRDEVAQTLSEPAAVDQELRQLFAVMADG